MTDVLYIYSKMLLISLLLCVNVGAKCVGNIASVDSVSLTQSNIVRDISGKVDSLAWQINSLNKDVSHIRDEVDTVSDTIGDYVNNGPKGLNWNMIGAIVSFFSIIVMIWVFCRTKKQTNEQIQKQHIDTERQIKQQYRLSKMQISKMQEHANERAKTLTDLGYQIQFSTSQIKDSVEHLERRFITERDKAKVEADYTSAVTNYEILSKDLENEYDHFIVNLNNSVIHQRSSIMKTYIRNITQTLSHYSKDQRIPDPQSFLDAIDDVVENPNLLNKREQIDKYKDEGYAYLNLLKNCIPIVFSIQ